MVRPTNWRGYCAEALGTFMLVALGPGAAMVATSTHAFGHGGVAAAFGLVVIVIVSVIGPVSGAHINPAVTFALWSLSRFESRDVAPYVIAQCAGAIAASSLTWWLLGADGGFGTTVPSVSIWRAFVIEAGFTGLLGFVIVAVTAEGNGSRHIVPFVIGLTVALGALVTGPLTGGSFNPARSLGPAVISGVWTAHWLYWAAPIVGMITGMHIAAAVQSSARSFR